MGQKCENCKFFKTQNLNQYACRRFPPQYFVPAPGQVHSGFPMVDKNEWCGEWVSGVTIDVQAVGVSSSLQQ